MNGKKSNTKSTKACGAKKASGTTASAKKTSARTTSKKKVTAE